ncbi:MAG: undecaprenyl-diphosphate phosphatase [Candidatus Levybacteria bacterium]|nr:undecaprenyl-diphosphate phosphatase [Candidatus Levybacteria bacterium]
MDIVHAVILGAVEGITEFLPISSTGHLILTSHFLKITQTEFAKSFEIIIQLGAILAIITLYWRSLFVQRSNWPKLFLAFAPTALVGFTLYPFIKDILLSSPNVTLVSLFVGGIVLIIIEKTHKERDFHTDSISHITNRQAVLIGMYQSISVIPGVSRAGATIIGGMLTGAKRKVAVEFSFLLAVPTILAATLLDLSHSYQTFSVQDLHLLLVGFCSSFVVAFFTVKFFVTYITKNNFILFGVYRIFIAIFYWIFLLR